MGGIFLLGWDLPRVLRKSEAFHLRKDESVRQIVYQNEQ